MRLHEGHERNQHDIRQAEDDHAGSAAAFKRKGFLAPHSVLDEHYQNEDTAALEELRKDLEKDIETHKGNIRNLREAADGEEGRDDDIDVLLARWEVELRTAEEARKRVIRTLALLQKKKRSEGTVIDDVGVSGAVPTLPTTKSTPLPPGFIPVVILFGPNGQVRRVHGLCRRSKVWILLWDESWGEMPDWVKGLPQHDAHRWGGKR